MTTPTITKMVQVYLDAAEVERLKCGKPDKSTVKNTLLGVRRFRNWLNERRASNGLERIGFDEEYPLVSIIKPPLIHSYLADMLKHGIKPLTAMTYLNQLQQLFARWVRPYYDDRSWKIPPFPSLGGRPAAPRYKRPSRDQLAKVKAWYEALSAKCIQDTESKAQVTQYPLWFVATMMLEFAMRNGDIMRLTKDNFITVDTKHYLNYTPHKTRHSSGRVVRWPIHSRLWERFLSHGSLNLPELSYETFAELNKVMRGFGFTGCKGAYELRKICVDHIYQRFGVEMATSISGDDIKTIIRYYADPAQPNIGEIMVTDLL